MAVLGSADSWWQSWKSGRTSVRFTSVLATEKHSFIAAFKRAVSNCTAGRNFDISERVVRECRQRDQIFNWRQTMRLPAQVGQVVLLLGNKFSFGNLKYVHRYALFPFMRFGGRLTFESTYNRVNMVVFSLEELIVPGMFRVPTLFLGYLFFIPQLTLPSQKISYLIIFVPHASSH